MSTHPEQAVLDAIAGLEQDEIGELVRWQIEEGRKRLPLGSDLTITVDMRTGQIADDGSRNPPIITVW
ncbi:hypothetical protein [Nocardia asiatica]|uniref:hypothetical protein n=1 Tax=Nocardia asiatica TaxID=209252 RepID=UPI002454BBD7|nr:hypothetical protein [Nocardia asiatica]